MARTTVACLQTPSRTKFKGQNDSCVYKVQFLHLGFGDSDPEIPGDDDYFLEMYSDGDDIQYDETTDVLTVTFDNDHEDDTVTVWVLRDVKREECFPSYPYCDDLSPCVVGEPNCDASNDANCYHPCNEEITDR